MMYSGTGRVTVVSLASGQPLPQFTEGSSPSILSEPAIITLQGAPSQVTSYQRQGDDLILNGQDSDAARYQNFFTQSDGRQSELLFQQEGSLQQARFGEGSASDSQAITTLIPAWHSLDSAASLTASKSSEASTTVGSSEVDGALAVSAAAQTTTANDSTAAVEATKASEAMPVSTLTAAPSEITAATPTLAEPVTSNAVVTTYPATPLPELTLDPVTGDNAVSYQEGIYGIEFTGTAAHLPSYTVIELTMGGKTWTGSVYENQWRVQISDGDVKAIKDGNYNITVSATDENGNGTSLSQDLLLITHYNSSNPKVTVHDITLASAVQHGDETWYTLSGTMDMPLPLKSFAVQSYEMMDWHNGVIKADGSWSVEVSAKDVSEGISSLTFGVLDGAGNWFEQNINVSVDLTTPVDAGSGGEVVPPVTEDNPTDGGATPPADGGTTVPEETPPVSGSPSLTINRFTGDAVLSADEKLTAQTLSGTTENLAADSTLTVKLNGETYTTTLASDGSWSVAIPAADLQALPVGANRFSVSFENSAGGITTASKNITVEASVPPADAPLPQPTIETPFGDGLMNSHERNQPFTLTGSTGVTGAGQKIALTIDDVSFAGTVDREGHWSVLLPLNQPLDLNLSEGTHDIELTVTDVWGQTGTASSTFIIDTLAPTVIVNTLAGDGLIDVTEINSPLVISGTSEAGSVIEVTFDTTKWNGTVDQNGHWQFSVPAETLQNMGEGSYSVIARVTDEAGNTGSGSSNVQIYASEALPTLTLDPITGDNAVSYQEGIYGIEFTGTAAHLPSYTVIELTMDGKTWTGSVYENQWRVQISDGDVKAIKDGNYNITVSATDENGNGTSLSQDLLLITHYNSSNPKVTVHDITLASAVQHGDETWYTLSGTMDMPLPLKSFAVQSYAMMDWHNGVIKADGSWSVEVSAKDVSEGISSLTFGVLDGAGNWFEQNINVSVDLTTPVDAGSGGEVVPPVTEDNPTDGGTITITPVVENPGEPETTPKSGEGVAATPAPTIDTPFGDGWLNRAEKKESETLTGTTGVTGSGQTVTVIIGGKTHAATVTDNGNWSLVLTPETMKAGFGNGKHGIIVTATDASEHTATINASYSVDTCPPKIAFDNLADDNKINLNAVTTELQISGKGEAGDIVTVKLGDHQWQTSVTSAGTWGVQLEAADAQTLAPGDYTLTASIRDAAGNTNHASLNVELYNADDFTGSSSFNVTYQNATGQWEQTQEPVRLPDLSASTETVTATAGTTVAEDNPIEVATQNSSAVTNSSITNEGSSTESSGSIHTESAAISHNIDGDANVAGTENNETFSLSSLHLLTSLDGGGGHDTLLLDGSHEALDFSTLGLKISGIEAIDLGTFGSNSVTLGQKDLLQLTDNASDALTIKGADGNAVTLSTTEGGVWNDVGQRTVDGQQYDLYHNTSASHEGSLADVLIQHNLQVQMV